MIFQSFWLVLPRRVSLNHHWTISYHPKIRAKLRIVTSSRPPSSAATLRRSRSKWDTCGTEHKGEICDKTIVNPRDNGIMIIYDGKNNTIVQYFSCWSWNQLFLTFSIVEPSFLGTILRIPSKMIWTYPSSIPQIAKSLQDPKSERNPFTNHS